MNIKYIQETDTFKKTNLLNAVVILMKHLILHLLKTRLCLVIQEIVALQTEFKLVIMVNFFQIYCRKCY